MHTLPLRSCSTPMTLETRRQVAICRDRHHHRVCQEIKEIQELHADDLHKCQRSISQGRKASQNDHDDAYNYR